MTEKIFTFEDIFVSHNVPPITSSFLSNLEYNSFFKKLCFRSMLSQEVSHFDFTIVYYLFLLPWGQDHPY